MRKIHNAVLVSLTAVFCLFATGFTVAQTTLSPTSVSFGNVVVNQSSVIKTVTLKNTQAVSLKITSLTLPAGGYAFDSSSTCANPGTLGAGLSCKINLTLTPTKLGAVPAGSLTINTDAGGAQSVPLSGTGVAPTSVTTSVSFGNVVVNEVSAVHMVTLTNNQLVPLGISSLSLPQGGYGFDSSSTTCPSSGSLGAGLSCNIGLTLTPAALGPVTGGSLSISTVPSGGSQLVPLSGTGVAPTTFSPTAMNFGNVVVNQTALGGLILKNNQLVPLGITSLTLLGDGFGFQPGGNTCPNPGNLAPGLSCGMGITFTPTSLGAAPAGSLTITTNAGNSPQTVTLTGTGVAPTVVSPTSVGFGNVIVNTASAVHTVTLTNYQSTALGITSLGLAGSGYGFDPTTTTCANPGTLGAGLSCKIGLTLTPAALGAVTGGSLTITTNAGNSPQTVTLSGTGVAPTVVSPTSVGFGNVIVNTSSAVHTVILTNYQLTPLGITSFGLAGSGYGFDPTTTTCANPGTLGAGLSCKIGLTLTPAALGAVTGGSLTITTNAGNSPQTVALSGTGVGQAMFNPSSLGFGSVVINTASAAKKITLTNYQSVPLNLTQITIPSPYAADPGTTTCAVGTPVSALGTCTIGVVFMPTTVGSQPGTLSVSDTAGNSPQTVSLTGTGETAASLSPATIGFGNVTVGTTSTTKTVTLHNNETGVVSITQVIFGGAFALDPGAITTCPQSGGSVSGALAAGASCVIGITFKPVATGAVTGQITVISTAANSPQFTALSGSGVLPVALSPASLGYGNVVMNTSVSKNVTLTNTQAIALNITAITPPASFAVSPATTTCLVGTPVPPVSSCVITLTYTPTALGAVPASANQLSIVDGAGTQTINLSGSGVAAVTLSSATLSFSTVVVNEPTVKTEKLTNNQTVPLTITSITGFAGGYTWDTTDTTCPLTPATLAPGQSCVIAVSLTATATGSQPGTISVNHDAAGSPQTFKLSASAVAPVVLSPTSLSFAAQYEGTTSAPKTVFLTNTQNVPLTIFSITPAGINAADFAVTSSCPMKPATVAPGSQCTLSVTFTPTGSGTRKATLSIADDALGTPQTIPLSGPGNAPVTISPLSITNYSANVGTTSAYKTVTITNSSTVGVHFSNFQLSGDFVPTLNTCPIGPLTSLDLGKSCTLTISFAPTIGGVRDGQLQVYDDAVTSPQVINLSGTGTSPLTITPTSLTFSAQKLSTTSPPKTITLTNHESQQESFTLATTGDFTAASTCIGGVIPAAPGSTCIISVNFVPSATGPRTGSLTIAHSAAIGSPLTVSLSGSGTTSNPPAAVAVVSPGAAVAGSKYASVMIYGNGWTHFGPASVISFTDTNSSSLPAAITAEVLAASTAAPNQILALLTIDPVCATPPVMPCAVTGARNIKVVTPLSGGGTETAQLNSAFIIADPNDAHVVTSVTPNVSAQGSTLSVDLQATGTNFVQGITFANFGDGVTVNNLTVKTPTEAVANITISNTTSIGYRTITLVTGGEFAATDSNGFQIGPNNAALLSISPNAAPQGWSGTVTLTTSGTHFLQDATQASITGGVTVGNVQVTSPTTATADVAVQQNATLGLQNVTVSTGGEIATLPNAFTITGSTAALISVTPASGQQGQTLDVEIVGNGFTTFNLGTILADFTGEITVNATTVKAANDVVVNITIHPDANVGGITARLTNTVSGNAMIFPFSFTVTPSSAQITSVTPNSVPQGGQLTLAVTAVGTNWVQGTTTAAFYPGGVPVPGVDKITITSPTSALLNIAVPTNTPPGNYGFYMATGGQVVNSTIKVYPNTPTLTVSPANGLIGTTVSVSFTGDFTHFSQTGTLPVVAGQGVTLQSFLVSGLMGATAKLAIDPAAALGPRLITFTTGGEIVTAYFNVTKTPVAITQISPYHGPQNTTMDVEIFGLNTSFTTGTTQVLFGPMITVNYLTVKSTTDLIANITTSYLDSGTPTQTPAGWQAVYVNTGAEQLITGFHVDGPATPTIVSVVPSSGAQGSVEDVVITGSLTGWVNNSTEAILGAGVSVSNLIVSGPTTATATIAVSPTAPVGGNSVIMITGTEIESSVAFSVTPSAALIKSVGPAVHCDANLASVVEVCGSGSGSGTPWVVSQLQTANLNIVGVGTHWLQGETKVSFGAGVVIDSLTVTSPTTATVQITVLSSAPVGFTPLTTYTDGEVVTLQQAIDVEQGFPTLLAITPNGAAQGASLSLQVLGRFTNWQQGVTTAAFNQDITVNSITVVDSNNLIANITVSPWAYVDYGTCGHVITITTGTEQVTGPQGMFCVSQGAAQINNVNPAVGVQGSTETVTVTGSATHFLQGVTTANFGPGINIGTITVSSPTSASVALAITASSTGDPTGFRTATLTTYGEVATQQYAFTVTPGVGTLNEAIPSQAEQGAPLIGRLVVQLIGQYTHFNNQSTATFGAGITVNSIAYISPTEVDADITIDPLSYVGGRTVTVTSPGVPCIMLVATNNPCPNGSTTGTGSEIVSASVFSIIPGPAIISQVVPATGNEGQEIVFTITGNYTHWAQNFTQFWIPGAGSDLTINSVIINSPTSATVDLSINPAAYPGARSIYMVTAGESLVNSGAFVVTGGVPVITYLSPNNGLQGTNQIQVTIHGLYTQWTQGTTTVNFGPGVTVTSYQVDDATHIEALVNVDSAAQPGYRTVVVQTGVQALTGNFLVTAPAPPPTPYISYYWPSSGLPGQTFTISFTGNYTHWDPDPTSGTQATFGDGIQVNTFQVTGPTSARASITINPATYAGSRLIVFTTGSETESAYFNVVVDVPTLSLVDPGSGMQGAQNLEVNIMGQYTTFDNTTVFNFGSGVTVNTDAVGNPLVTILGPTIATVSVRIDQLATLGYRGVTATTGAQVVGGAGFSVAPSLALISAIAANTAKQGDTITVDVTGKNTHWGPATKFTFGAGIVVTSTTVNNNTDATLQLAIPAMASLGATWATAQTAGEVANISNGFVVQAGTPLLLSSGPGSAPQQGNVVFTILSQATQWLTNPPTVYFGDGITLTSVHVTGDTSLTVDGYIQPTTTTGCRNLTVSTGTQALGMSCAFYVTPGPAVINSVSAATAGQGASLTVNITGINTHWVQGTTLLTFPGALITSFTVTSPTSITANITVSDYASAGPVSVTATTLGEVATGINVFTITQTQPELLGIVSSTGALGLTETITLTGQFTHFNNGVSTANFGSGITVNSVTAVSTTVVQANITVQPTTTLGYRSVSVSTGSEVVSITNAFRVTQGPAAIAGALNPGSGGQGNSLTVLVTGSQTHFASGTTTATFGGGISVTGIAVVDALHANVTISIPNNTSLGVYDVTLTTGGEVATILGGFTVTVGAAQLSVVSPPTGHQGDNHLSVTLTGLFTNFVNGTSNADFGAGIHVNSTSVNSLTSAVADISIDPAATLGSRTVKVTTNTETAPIVGGFTVLAGIPQLLSAALPTAQAGTTANIVITGEFTTFQQGFSTASFGSGVTTNFTTVGDITHLTANISIAANALVGSRDVTVTTGAQVLTLSSGFTVTAGTPVITQINPNIGNPGTNNVTVTITGQYTNWINGTTTAKFGPQISVGGAPAGTSGPVTVNNTQNLTASLTIPPGTSLGPVDVTVTTGAEVDPVPGGFTVQAATIPAPYLLSLSPGNNAGNVPINSSLIAYFSQPMNRNTITTSSMILYLASNPGGWLQVPVSVLVDATGRKLTITPNSLMAVNSQYYLNLQNSIKDATGNTFQNYGEYFNTVFTANSAPPTVVAANPPALSTVGTNVLIQLQLSADMDQTIQSGLTVSTGGNPVAGTYSWNSSPSSYSGPGNLLTFTPTVPLQANTTYLVSYGAPLADTTGNGLTAGSFTFTTGSGPDTAQNNTSIDFANWQSNVGTNFIPKVTFSKPVNPIDVNTSTLLLYNADSGKYVAGTVNLAPNGLSATFTPTYPLLPNTYYYVHMAWGNYDADANYLNGVNGYFTTGSGSDLAPPQAVISPADGSTSVPLNTAVVVHFSEAIDPGNYGVVTVTPAGGSAIAGTVALASDQVTLTFAPTSILTGGTTYTVQVSGYKDLAGNLGTATSATFTTMASIAPIILSTGLDASGNLITVGDTNDPHWVVNGGPTAAMVVAPGNTDWYSGWLANGPNSAWIAPNPDSGATANIGDTFSTTFNWSGPTTNVCLVGGMATDDWGTLALNGQPLLTNSRGWTSLAPFSVPIGSILNAGTNTLTLTWVNHDSSNTGFRLQAAVQTCSVTYNSGLSLVSSTPTSGAISVATNTSITLNFNNALDPATVNPSTLPVMVGWNSNQILAGTYQVNGNQVIFTPASPFPISTQIWVGACNGPYDLAGEYISGCYTQLINFTTGSTATASGPFQVTAFTPAANATNVGLRAPVVATFNRSFNPSTVSGGDFALFANDSQSPWCTNYSRSQDNSTLSFNCYALPSSDIMTAMINSGIQDWSGNALTNFTSQFTTSQYDSNTNGTVISTRPGNGSSGIDPNSPITVYTNLPISLASANSGIQVAQNNVALAGVVQVLDNGYALEFKPNSPFTAGALIQWWTTSSLTDSTYGTPINTASGYFYVAGDTSTVKPTVQVASPPTGSTVALNSFIDIQFNTPLDPNTVSDSQGNCTNVYLYDASTGLNVSATCSSATSLTNVVRIAPSSNLPVNHSFLVYVQTGLHSSTSVPAAYNAWWYYTSGASVDSNLPLIASAVPYNGASGVGVNATPGVVFSKAIDPVSVNSNTFQVLNGVTPLAGSYWFSSDDTRVNFVPNAPLPANTNLMMSINGVLDRVGHPVTFSSSFQTSAGPDFTQPTVLWTSASTNGNIPINSVMTIQFSESMDITGFNSSNTRIYDTLLGANIATTLSWSSDQSIAYLTPTSPLAAGRQYYLYVSGGADLCGNSVQSMSLYFYAQYASASTAPTVVNWNPLSGATGLGTNVIIEAQFNAPIDPTTVGGVPLTGGGAVPFTPSMSAGNTVLQLVPQKPLAANTTYLVTIAGVKDPAGNLVATVTNSFTTGPSYDIAGPSLVNYDPPNNSTVGTNVVPKMVFNKPLNPITVSNSTFRMYLSDTGQWIPLTVTPSANGLTVTLQPQVALIPNTRYHYQACCGYQDQDGNNGNQTDLYFYTGSGTDTTGPTVTVSPATGVSGVPLNVQIVASISKPIDPTSWSQSSIQLLDSSSHPVTGTVSEPDTQTLVFVPTSSLLVGMTYTVNVSGFTDADGNAVTSSGSTFTTGGVAATGGLTLTSTNVPWGATNVSNTQQLVLTFSQILNPQTVNASTVRVWSAWNSNLGLAGTYSVSGNTVTFTPTSPYPAGATMYVVTCYGPTDVAGDVYGGCWTQVMYFGVSSTPDTSPLQVVSVNPPSGATGVRHDIPVSVAFNKSINVSSANSNSHALLFAGQSLAVNNSITMSVDNRTMTFNNGALSDGTTYTIALPAGGITDQSGNALASTFTSTFTTATNPATGNGSVAHVSPNWNASGIPADTLLTLYLNRPVDPSTLPGNMVVTVNGQVYAGSVQATASGYEVQFTPTVPFPNGAAVQWWFSVVSNVNDVYGNPFNSNSGYFSTLAAVNPATATPQIVAVSPPSSWSNTMPTNGEIDIQYNLPIDVTTLTGNVYFNTGTSATLTLASPNVVRMTPNAPLSASSQYYVCANSNVKGTNGVNASGGCWTTYFTTTAGPDTTSGTVKIGPPNGAVNVGTNAYIRLVFSKAVDVTSINATTVQVTSSDNAIDGVWSWVYSGGDIVGANYTPVNPLPPSSTVKVSVNGILDYAGNQFSAPTAQFQTAALPDFSAASVSLDFAGNTSGIATNASFSCRYSKAMDPSSITPSGTYVYSYVANASVPVTYTFSTDLMSVTMTPTSPLFANSEYRYYCNSAIDLTGNGQSNNSVYFYAGNSASSAGPTLLYTNPPNGITGVALNTNNGPWCSTSVGLLFNEPVSEASLGNITLTPQGGSPMPIGLCQEIGDTAVMVELPYNLQPNTKYTFNVTGVTDYAGNPITPVTSSFTTGSSFDWTAPFVTTFVPANGAPNVDVNTPLSVTFSEPMSPVLMSSNQIFLRNHNTSVVIPTTLSFSPDYTTVYLTLAASLDPVTKYDLYMWINNWWISDIAGNNVNTSQTYSTFTTGTPTAVTGVCGSANGGSFSSAPTANLCSAGTASAITNTGTWSWTCGGQYGGAGSPACSANVTFTAACAPQPFGLVSWWKGEGNANDQTGNNNGTLVNSPSFALGAVGDAFSFNGNNQYVLIGQPVPTNLQIQNAITLSAWIYVTGYPTDHGSGPFGMIVGSQHDGTDAGATIFYDGRTDPGSSSGVPPGHITFQIGDGSLWHETDTTSQVPLNQWVLITATRSANNPAQIYYNGVLQPSTALNSTWTGTISYSGAWFAIGQQSDQNRGFNGLIDEVQVYNRALTPLEVQTIYNAASAGACPVGAATTTSLTSSANPAFAGATVNFTATVSPNTATGTITFMDGGTVLGSPLTLSAGQAFYNTSALALGSHTITAVYSGDANFSDSVSAPVTQSVNTTSCATQPVGLISWWPGDGNANDIVGPSSALAGGGVSYAAGKVGQAFSFDGSTGYVEKISPDSSLNIRTQSWTVSAWIQSSYSGTDVLEIVSRYACGWDCSSGNAADYLFALDGSGRASFEVRDSSGNDVMTTGTSNLRDGAWHLVTGVLGRSGAQLSIYVDGALQNSVSSSAIGDIYDSGSPLEIGRFFRQGWASPLDYFSGLIDEVQIYNRALAASEIQAIYNAGSAGVCH